MKTTTRTFNKGYWGAIAKYALQLILFIIVCTTICNNAIAQTCASTSDLPWEWPSHRNWFFGTNTRGTFNAGALNFSTLSGTDSYEGTTIVSNDAGNLLFLANGVKVWNAAGTETYGGLLSGQGGTGKNSAVQGIITVKHPLIRNRYFMLTTDDALDGAGAHGLNFFTFNNTGNLVAGPTQIFGSTTEGIAATKHANGLDIWIVIHEPGTRRLRAYLLTCSGTLSPAVVTDNVAANVAVSDPMRGGMKFSPDGSTFAEAYGASGLTVMRFNNATGAFSNGQAIGNPALGWPQAYDVEFSPNGNRLYVSTLSSVSTYSLATFTVAAIRASESLVASGMGNFGALEIGANGVLYYHPGELRSISGNLNAGTGLTVSGALRPNEGRLGLPVMYLPPDEYVRISPQADLCVTDAAVNLSTNFVCLGTTAEDASNRYSGPGITNAATGVFNPATAGVGTHTITFTRCDATHSIQITVTPCGCPAVSGTPTITGTPTTFCAGGNTTLTGNTVAANNGYYYEWRNNSGTVISSGTVSSTTINSPTITTAGTYTFRLANTSANINDNACYKQATQVITVTALPAAPTVANVTYCQNATATALTATGTALRWYSAASGGTALGSAPTPSTATAGSPAVSYWVSQTVSSCEGPRAQINVNVTATPAAPTVTTPVTYCQNATATALTATGTALRWYSAATGGTALGAAPTPSTATAGSPAVSYWVSQTISSCEGPRAQIDVNVTATPAAPTVTTPVTYCQNATATALTATGTGLRWYSAASGGTALGAAPTPSTATAGSPAVSYWVSQTVSSCESPRAQINVNVNATPAAPTATAPQYCQDEVAPALSATGTGLLWYTAATGGTGTATAPSVSTATPGTTSHWVSQTISSCEGPRLRIDVLVVAKPVLPTLPDATACNNGTASFNIIPTNTLTSPTYQWESRPASGSFSPVAGPQGTGATLTYNPVTAAMDQTGVRVTVTETVSGKTCSTTSNEATLNINNNTTITSFTASATSLCEGDALTLTGVVGGTAPFNYTLRLGATVVDTRTAQASSTYTYTVNPVVAGTHNGTYTLEVTSACSGSPTSTVAIAINKAVISSNPDPETRCSGTSATFTVGTTGSIGTLTYRWYRGATIPGTLLTNGGNISGATTATLTIANVSAADAGSYYVEVIANGACTETSTPVALNLLPGSTITTQPVITPKCIGEAASMSVLVTPAGSAYQWYKDTDATPLADGGTITGSTTSTLNISSVALTDAGTYYVKVTTTCGELESDKTSILAVNGVTVTAQPTDQGTCNNGNVTFSVTATGQGLTYQWQVNPSGTGTFTDIPGATNANLPINPVLTSMDGNTYRVNILSNGLCPVTSDVVELSVTNNTVINTQPVGGNYCQGEALNLTVDGSGTGTPTYQWYLNNAAIAGATNQNYSVAAITVADAGTYKVEVTTTCGMVTSNDVTVTVTPTPLDNLPVTSPDICLGTAGTVEVANSQNNVTYQIYDGATPVGSVVAGNGGTITLSVPSMLLATAGVHNFVVKADPGAGCPLVQLLDEVEINVIGLPGQITGPTSVCTNANTGLVFSVTDIVPINNPVTYNWNVSGGTIVSGTGSTSISVDLNATGVPGLITLSTITTATANCPVDFNRTVNQVLDYSDEGLTISEDTICAGNTVTFTITNANATGYNWSTGLGVHDQSVTVNTPKVFRFDTPGDITVTLMPVHPCRTSITPISRTIHVIETPVAIAGNDVHLNNLVPVTLDGTGSSTGNIYRYVWSSSDPGAVIQNPNSLVTTSMPSELNSTYTLTVYTTNTAGCSASDDMVLTIDPIVKIPNVFSPNNDGNHDVFVIQNIQFFPDAVLYIYNQWGELIYKSQAGYPEPWNGTRGGAECAVSAYYYVLELNKKDYKPMAGSVTIIR